jgi:hypothetical protein
VSLIVPKITDRRCAMYAFGVELGADSDVLAISGLKRLVWVKPHFFMVGANGMPGARQHCATMLAIRHFKRLSSLHTNETYLQWDFEEELFEGGRLSKAKLVQHQSKIDAAFGQGATEQLEIGKTVIFGYDEIGAYLAQQQAKPVFMDSKTAALIEAARNARWTTDDEKL